MNNIKIEAPEALLAKLIAESCGLYAYRKTLDLTKIAEAEYQRNFVSYYRVRRDRAWLTEYFNYMQTSAGDQNIAFEQILKHISSVAHNTRYGKEQCVEASFASKMLATLDPRFPIWDSQVRKAVGIKDDPSRKMNDYVRLYGELTEKVHAFLHTYDGAKCVEAFDNAFPDFIDISPVKKIDLFLWKAGK